MKPRKYFSILFVVAQFVSSAQGIRFESDIHDFGKMKQNEKLNTTFHFKNVGSDTIRLLEPKASCGCTAALLSDYTVAPGREGTISVTFSTVTGMSGKVEKNVHVYRRLGTGEQEIATLIIKANIFGDVVVDSPMVRFTLHVGETQTFRIHVSSTSKEMVVLDNISLAMMAYIDTTAGNTYHAEKVQAIPVTDYVLSVDKAELNPNESTDILLTLRGIDKGQMNGHIRIALPKSEIRVPVVGVVLRN